MNAYRMHDVANAMRTTRRPAAPKAQVAVLELEEDLWDIATRRTAGFDDEAEAEVRLHDYRNG